MPNGMGGMAGLFAKNPQGATIQPRVAPPSGGFMGGPRDRSNTAGLLRNVGGNKMQVVQPVNRPEISPEMATQLLQRVQGNPQMLARANAMGAKLPGAPTVGGMLADPTQLGKALDTYNSGALDPYLQGYY